MLTKSCGLVCGKLLFCISLVATTVSSTGAGMLENWHWRNPAPFASTLRSVCFGQDKFVAVGDGGVVHTSLDGLAWDDGRRPVTSTLHKVIFHNGLFVAVGERGVILTSADGFDWVQRSSGTSSALYGIVFGNGKYVACGGAGQLTVSSDASAWIPGTVGSIDLRWITFGNGVFVVQGPSISMGQLAVMVSDDGETWTRASFPAGSANGFPSLLHQVAFGNGCFLAAASAEDHPFDPIFDPILRYFRSVDGTNWTREAIACGSPGYNNHAFLSYANGLFYEFVGSGNGEPHLNFILSTADGTTSSPMQRPDPAFGVTDLAHGAGLYVLVGSAGRVWTSTNAISWSPNYGAPQPFVKQICGGGGKYIAVGGGYHYAAVSEPGMRMLASSDGVNFLPVAGSPVLPYRSVGFDGSNYVAVAKDSYPGSMYVYTSTNGTYWVPRTSNTTSDLKRVCRGSQRWIAVGAGGTVITSPNTLAWTLRMSGTANDLLGVASGGNTCVAVGSSGTVITSSDGGASWDAQFSGTTATLADVQHLNGRFFAVGYHGVSTFTGVILTSIDGSTWDVQNASPNSALRSIAYGGGRYLVCGYDYSGANIVLTSTNGLDWQDVTASVPAATALGGVAFLDGSFWVTGDNGTILQSDSVDALPRLTGGLLPGDRGFRLQITLNAPPSHRIQTCTDPQFNTWLEVACVTNCRSPYTWIDTNVTRAPIRLYRIVSP